MRFKPITLAEKALFNGYLAGRRQDLITYNFTNLFLWREWDPYGWTELEGALCIKSDYYGWDAVIAPMSPDDQAVLRATEALIAWYAERKVPFLMTELSQGMVDFYERYLPGRFCFCEYRPGFNYLYLQEDLAGLRGQRFAAKRNHVHRFERENPDFRFVPLAPEHVPGCRALESKWLEVHDVKSDEIMQEHHGVMEALAHYQQLDARGACLLVNDEVAAFTLGEPLNDDTFIIHVEKGNIDIHGTYQAINQYFARDYAVGYTYINRAEDMGHPGQRKAKQSYHPHHLEKKYHGRLRAQL